MMAGIGQHQFGWYAWLDEGASRTASLHATYELAEQWLRRLR